MKSLLFVPRHSSTDVFFAVLTVSTFEAGYPSAAVVALIVGLLASFVAAIRGWDR